MTFRIEYNNDVGYDDEGFWEWWTVTDDIRGFKCDAEADAIWLRDLLNGLRPLFDAQDAANGKPVSKMWADDLNIQLGGGGGSGTAGGIPIRFTYPEPTSTAAGRDSVVQVWASQTTDPPTPPHHKKPDKPTA